MSNGTEVVLAHGGADSTATFLIMAALGVSGVLPVVALVLFFVAGVRRRDQDSNDDQDHDRHEEKTGAAPTR